jgi:hypothetical protein
MAGCKFWRMGSFERRRLTYWRRSIADWYTHMVSATLFSGEPLGYMLLLAFAVSVACNSPSTGCDFSLPPFRISTMLSHSAFYPPLPVTSSESRYSWTCRPPHESRGAPFVVLLSANVPVSGMLALAFQENVSLHAEMIMTDFPSDDSNPDLQPEWGIGALASLSGAFEPSFSLPTLRLKFGADACGCIKRVRFTWDGRGLADYGSCESLVSVHTDSGGIDAASGCFPSWAFPRSFDAKTELEHSAFERSTPQLVTELLPSNPCHPVHSMDLPLPQKAIRTASFNGHCK